MEEQDLIEIVLSNVDRVGGKLQNFGLVSRLLQEVDLSKFDLKVLDDVFKSFEKSFSPERPIMDVFPEMELGTKRKQPVIFDYKGFQWSGKCIWEKWFNSQDKQVWNTVSLKLPNDGYIYNKNHENVEEGVQVLKEDSFRHLENVLTYALNFFDDDAISVRVFYLTNKSRLNIKVRSEKHKSWLQITYDEYGYPRERISKWYTKNDMLTLLRNK